MAKIIEPANGQALTARWRHGCGALVEFTKDDIHSDPRDGDYVICPACKTTPWIAVSILPWTL